MVNRPDYVNPYNLDDSDDWSDIHSDEEGDAPVDPLAPYKPPRIPLGLTHVVRFATESGDLSWRERSIVILLSRFANHDGAATVGVARLCRATRIGSKNTVEKALNLASDLEILRKESGKGGNGKARKSNKYFFLGKDRNWEPLPQTRPGTPPVVALALATRRIEQQDIRIRALEAELALLRNGSSNSFIGHQVTSEVTNENGGTPPNTDFHSYETESSELGEGNGHSIGHKKVTNENGDALPATGSHSYKTRGSEAPEENGSFIGHKKVTNENDETQQYLARHTRVEETVMEHRAYFTSSFRGGVNSAIYHFSQSAENEEDLLRQVERQRRAQEPPDPGTGPPPEDEAPSQSPAGPDRYAVGECPDCGRPFATYGGAEYCSDCTERRIRESEG